MDVANINAPGQIVLSGESSKIVVAAALVLVVVVVQVNVVVVVVFVHPFHDEFCEISEDERTPLKVFLRSRSKRNIVKSVF